MEQRYITVQLDPTAVERFDAAITNGDDDVLLQVEKAIVATMYPERVVRGQMPEVDLDVDLVAVEPGR